jgi:hypothetical protein
MECMTPKERRDALDVIVAEGSLKSLWHARRWLNGVLSLAHRLHVVYESQCSRDLGPAGNANRESARRNLESQLRFKFREAGLGLYLNSDPRGNPVGILTPKTGRYNTMGGAESGWRL